MPRRRIPSEVEVKPPREYRIIIYLNEANLKRWKKLYVDMDVKNYEEALMKLLDLYELSSKYLGARRIDELIKKLNDVLGISVRMKVVGP